MERVLIFPPRHRRPCGRSKLQVFVLSLLQIVRRFTCTKVADEFCYCRRNRYINPPNRRHVRDVRSTVTVAYEINYYRVVWPGHRPRGTVNKSYVEQEKGKQDNCA